MVIKNEQRDLLQRVSDLDTSISEIDKEKKKLEKLVQGEIGAINKLNSERATTVGKLHSLKDQGILYCGKCNDLYEMSDARLERKEGEIVVGSYDLDPDRYRNIYAHGVELNYYCPKCDSYITGKTRKL